LGTTAVGYTSSRSYLRIYIAPIKKKLIRSTLSVSAQRKQNSLEEVRDTPFKIFLRMAGGRSFHNEGPITANT